MVEIILRLTGISLAISPYDRASPSVAPASLALLFTMIALCLLTLSLTTAVTSQGKYCIILYEPIILTDSFLLLLICFSSCALPSVSVSSLVQGYQRQRT